ncbi:zinc knuckle CX2CX4HX4C containing protein [Tanacetum coccineum]
MIHVAGPSMKGKLQSDVKKDKRPVQATDNKGKGKQISSQRYIKGYRVNVPKSKFVYRAVVKPQDVSNVTSNMEKSLDTTTKPSPSDSSKGGTSFSNDDISLAELRTFVDKSMQEESVLEYVGLNDIKGCTSRGKLDEKVSCKKSRSSMEVINEDSDTDVDEDFVPNDGNTFPCSSSGGGGHSLEEDAYDDYEVQFEEYPSDYQEFCDQFDFKVKGLEMEQGFLSRSNKASLKNDGNMGSLLSELAKKVKNIDGKILGRDGKPMMPYRCVKDKVTFSDDVAVVMDNKNDDGEVGSFKSTSINTENNHGATGVIGEDCTLADVIIPQEEVDTLSARFENSLYGYFVGRRLAFPVVQNYARNAWGKYGFKNVMVHQGFFMFQFSTKEGMENVLDQGPWRIRSVPLILNVWNPISELKREDIKKVPVWVKLFNVPVVAYSKVGLNLITAKLGRLIKFDAHTSNMCLNSWGMNSYARVLVEISAEKELVESLVVAVPIDKNKGHRLVSIEIEFEYRPPRCSVCKVFDHIDKECHKKEKEEIQNTNKEDGLGYDKRKSKGQLRSYIDKHMEEDKVIDLNTDVVVSTNNSYAPEKDNESKKARFLEKFLKTREASKNKHHSLSDSEESEVEEVCMPDHISGGGSLDHLEDDLDGYDGMRLSFVI